jgi:hypothetical protein
MFDRVTHDPNVLGGRATLRGLRISVAHVVNLVANGLRGNGHDALDVREVGLQRASDREIAMGSVPSSRNRVRAGQQPRL